METLDRCRAATIRKRAATIGRGPRYDDYLVEHANGDFIAYRLPRCFAPREFAAKLPHSLVFLKLRRGCQCFTSGDTIDGPCWLLIDSDPKRDAKRVENPREYVQGGVA